MNSTLSRLAIVATSIALLPHCSGSGSATSGTGDDGGPGSGSSGGPSGGSTSSGGGSTSTSSSGSSSGSASSSGSSSSGGSPASGSSGSSSGGSSGSSGSASDAGSGLPPGIQYFGRWDTTNQSSPAGSWGPIGLRARFEGTSVAVTLNDPNNTFEVSVDGAPMTMLGPTSQTQVSLATGLADGDHTLEFWRRSEGGFGETIVSGLVLDPGKSLLSPDARPPHKIEVLGDSISAGFGDEGMGGSSPETQNGYMAYGPQLARMLDAEWSVIAHSGQGMYRNLCEPIPPTQQHMPDEFKLTQHPFVVGAPPWDFTRWQADVLIVTLGTNDFADYPPGSCTPPDEAAFEAAYEGFLAFARGVYPKAEIFALGTFIAAAGNQFVTCNADIGTAVSHMNDAHMHFIDPSNGPDGMWLVGPGDYIGDWTHPTVAGHTKIATHLKSIIQPIMGW